MIVDCDRCAVRGYACHDCAITVLLGAPPDGLELDGTERRALHTLAEAGLIPPLRLVDASVIPGTAPGITPGMAELSEPSPLPLGTTGQRFATSGKRSVRRVS
jgi:hypothetical protein